MNPDFTTLRADHGKAWRWPMLFLAIFFALNFATLSRMPFVWLDEVYFADPAINVVQGDGFISRAWDHSPETRTVSITSPTYTWLLAGWVKLFGGNLLAVRSLGLFLTFVGILVLWSACQRWNVLVSPQWLTAMGIVIACTYGFAFSYRGGRPEALLFLIWAVLFHATTWKHTSIQFAVLFLLGAIMPFTGQVACMALCTLLGILIILSPRRWISLAVTLITGVALGTLCFTITYKSMGIWADYLIMVNQQGGSPLQRLIHRLTSNPLTQHSNTLPKDFSLVPLLLGLGWMTVLSWRERTLRWNSLLSFGLLYAFTIPAVLYLFGKFPTYYSWLLTVPLVLVLAVLCWREESQSRRKLWVPRFALTGACIVGLPLQVAFALPDWRDRDYGPVKTWTEEVLRPTDIALVDYPFYYAARASAKRVYLYGYGELLQPEDVQALTALILSPHKTYGLPRKELMQRLGDDWAPTGEKFRVQPSFGGNSWQLGFLSLPNYDGDVYRRRTNVQVLSTTSQKADMAQENAPLRDL